MTDPFGLSDSQRFQQQLNTILAAVMYKMGWREIRLEYGDLAKISPDHMIQSYQVQDPPGVIVRLLPPPPPVHDYYADGEVLDADIIDVTPDMIEPPHND